MTNGQIRAVRDIVKRFKKEQPEAKIKVTKGGDCYINEHKVLNFNSLLNENENSYTYFINKMREFYNNMVNNGLDIDRDKIHTVIYESTKRNLKFIGRNDEGRYIFEEVDTPINPSKHEKYYFTENQTKKLLGYDE